MCGGLGRSWMPVRSSRSSNTRNDSGAYSSSVETPSPNVSWTGGCLPEASFFVGLLLATQAPYADENILSFGATGRSESLSPVGTEVCAISSLFDWRIDSVKASTAVSEEGCPEDDIDPP